MKLRVKFLDILIIFLAAGLTLFTAFTAYVKPQSAARVLIRGQDREWTFLLNSDETVVVAGPLGDTIVRIGENSAWVESSPCANQTCIASGHLARQGQWAACLPNNVLVMIHGAEDDDVDASAW